ncbi:hypothetical protein ABVK25_005398 [Lepraria finkii]|uniref:Zn(2)-C6 fungal-type domain-containing protein n=1 Tax=Lepraria finkii TaxID=1340010 RepID=A0ABR4BA38_9LECA
MEGHEARRRVVKACQRCRLKRRKRNGSSPCTRCKSDDAICAYGKHKKSDKAVFRKGYVQMLEFQHTQLIAGLQELYRRIQSGESFPTSSALEPAHYGQPLHTRSSKPSASSKATNGTKIIARASKTTARCRISTSVNPTPRICFHI